MGPHPCSKCDKCGTIPTLQQVLDNNHNLVNSNNFQGTLAGNSQTGTDVNAFGNRAGIFNTGIWINAFGISAAESNVGNQVNAFGYNAGEGNSGSDVNFLGNVAGQSNSGGAVNGLGLYAASNNTGNSVNAFGDQAGYGNTANDVNLFGKNASATANNQIVYTTDDGTYQTRLQQNNTQDNLINIPNESGTLLLDAPADGNLYGRQDNAWAIVSGGGGGGTVTSISQGYGITNSPNPIVSTGTITADTSVSGLSGKYLRLTDTSNMLSPYPIGSGAATTVAFWNGTRSLTKNSQIAIDNTTPTSPSLQVRASTGSTRSFMNSTYSGVQYNATNYAINNIYTNSHSFINHEEIINRESRLYSNSLQFSNLSTSGFVTLNPPTSFNNRTYTLPDSSGTIALKDYTIDSLKRNAGTDSVFARKNGQWNFQYRDSVGGAATPSGYYGAFSDTLSQTNGGVGVANLMQLRLTDLTNGVSVSSSKIVFANAGIYNLQYSAQFVNADNSSEQSVSIWIRKNGVNVDGSTGVIQLPKKGSGLNGETLPSWNFLLSLAAGDSISWYWSSPSTQVSISKFASSTSPTRPSTASVVMTVTQQSGIMAGTGITGIGTSGNAQTGATQVLATGTSGTDFAISSSSNTQTFNLPTASASNTGKLSSTDWSTFNGKIGASDTSVFQRKNIAAYSMQANNTASAANVTTQTFRDVAEAAISTTITWVTGTAPTSLTSANYSWSQIGKNVTVQVNLLYANASSGITAFYFDLPSDMPLPVTPTGWSAASSNLFTSICTVHATTPAITSTSFYSFLRRNAANNGYELGATGSAANARGWKFTLTYKAQ